MSTRKKPTLILPPIGEDDALIDVKAVCLLIGMSTSWAHAEVAAGRFPAPAIRGSRCTRWRAGTVRQWLRDRIAAASAAEAEEAEKLRRRAKLASDAAHHKRTGVGAVSSAGAKVSQEVQ